MPSNAPLWIGVTSVAEMSIISIFWYTAIAHIFSSNRFKKLYLNSKVWIERFSGIVFIGFGVKLLVKE
jgi:threonine/homoserine/homoserine lactone efflux protein